MAFSIKNAEADRLLREIVALTGEDLTSAVIAALRERLVTVKRFERRDERLRELRALRDRMLAETPPGAPSSAEIDAEMYDEDGLPR